MATGAALIAAERQRQIDAEGWTTEHDAEHASGELRRAAIAYTQRPTSDTPPPPVWPWADEYWKPSNDQIRNLVKAGALIAAEIDRLQGEPRPFCASSAEAAQLTDDEFWAAAYCRTPRDDEADIEAAVDALNHETWMIHCARCGRFVEVDEDERIDRERDAFCDDCADEHHPDLEGGLYS